MRVLFSLGVFGPDGDDGPSDYYALVRQMTHPPALGWEVRVLQDEPEKEAVEADVWHVLYDPFADTAEVELRHASDWPPEGIRADLLAAGWVTIGDAYESGMMDTRNFNGG